MKYVICSICDTKAEAWMRPMYFRSTAEALRAFVGAVNEQEGDIAKFFLDMSLWIIGSWDEQTGEVSVDDTRCLARGVDVKREADNLP